MALIASLELEAFCVKVPCEDVLRQVRADHDQAPLYGGKGGGLWLDLDGPAGPITCKVAGDSPCCGDDVFEISLPELASPDEGLRLLADYITPFLSRLEQQTGAAFLLGGDLYGHKVAFQVNVSLPAGGLYLYQAMAPFLVTLPALLGPGGPVPDPVRGYVRGPRLHRHTRCYMDRRPYSSPLAYPREAHHGSGHRLHVSLEWYRGPSIWLALGATTLVAWCVYRHPGRYAELRMLDDLLPAGRQLTHVEEGLVPVRVGSELKHWTGLDVQEHILATTEQCVAETDQELPAWAAELCGIWRETLEAVREGRIAPFSDWTLKRALVEQVLAPAGLSLDDAECQAAYGALAMLLAKGYDPETCLTGSEDRWPAGFTCGLSPQRLATLYDQALRDALRLEVAWARATNPLVQRFLHEAMALRPRSSEPELAPRAQARQTLLHASNTWRAVAEWDAVWTWDRGRVELGAPEEGLEGS